MKKWLRAVGAVLCASLIAGCGTTGEATREPRTASHERTKISSPRGRVVEMRRPARAIVAVAVQTPAPAQASVQSATRAEELETACWFDVQTADFLERNDFTAPTMARTIKPEVKRLRAKYGFASYGALYDAVKKAQGR